MNDDISQYGFSEIEELDLPQDRLIDIIASNEDIRDRLDPDFESRDIKDHPETFDENFLDENLDLKLKSYIAGEDGEELNMRIKSAFAELRKNDWNRLDDGGFA